MIVEGAASAGIAAIVAPRFAIERHNRIVGAANRLEPWSGSEPAIRDRSESEPCAPRWSYGRIPCPPRCWTAWAMNWMRVASYAP